MPRKALAVVGLFVPLVIVAGCASPTPTPEPTAATPTPLPTATPTAQPTAAPRVSEYAVGLGYADADGLGGNDAEIYAGAFADAKALGLGDADARAYADSLVYLNAMTSFKGWGTYFADAHISPFVAGFAEAVTIDGASASEAIPRAYAATIGDEACAGAYSRAFAQTDASGVASHLYASEYVGPACRYADELPDWMASYGDAIASALARGYTLSNAPSVQERIDYAALYLDGYIDAAVREAPRMPGPTNASAESLMRVLADVIAEWSEERARVYASAYADAKLAGRSNEDARAYAAAYREAYTSRAEAGATDEEARRYAAAFADAELGS